MTDPVDDGQAIMIPTWCPQCRNRINYAATSTLLEIWCSLRGTGGCWWSLRYSLTPEEAHSLMDHKIEYPLGEQTHVEAFRH